MLRHCDLSLKCTNAMDTWGAPTRVLQICIPPCPSPHLQSTESLLALLPGVLGPPGVPQRFRTRCISAGCRLHDDIIKKATIKTMGEPASLTCQTQGTVTRSPLSLHRTKRNSAAVCFTPMSTCVIRRTSLFLRVEPTSGLIFTSVNGGSTCRCR